jgi:DNA polymerase-3 subunit delta'
MAFHDIPGQEPVKAQLQTSLRNGTLTHAYIFEGLKGTGRAKMALTLAQAAHCLEKTDDACGDCIACRKIANGNHPDVIWVDPDEATIKIEHVRGLQKMLSYRALSTLPRFYIIVGAQRLTLQAGNALLTMLEEPSAFTIAVLLTENGQALLSTIRSRSQKLLFLPILPAAMLATLREEGLPDPIVRAAVCLAPGLETARELALAPWFAETRNAMLQLIQTANQGFSSVLLAIPPMLARSEISEHLDTVFDFFALWSKDMIYRQYQQFDRMVFTDHADMQATRAHVKPLQYWVRVMEEAMRSKQNLRRNANPQLVLERFFIVLQEGR